MIKGAIQRRVITGFIKVKEYLLWKQPEVISQLVDAKLLIANVEPVCEPVCSDDYLSFDEWKRIMEEPPKPGRAGGD